MEKTYKNCQSCGMPFKKDPQGGGTESDGSKSRLFCSHCFAAGEFTQPDLTAAQMQRFVKDKLRTMGFPNFVAVFFTRGIPNLERWK